MSEEQMRLLKMVEEHKITAEEGAKLLAALGEAQAARDRAEQLANRANARVNRNREDLFWGRQAMDEAQVELEAERERLREERERLREENRQQREDAKRQTNEGRRSRGSRTTPLNETQVNPEQGKYFRVRVSARDSGEAKVDLRLPLSLVNFGLKVGAKYLPDDISLNNEEVLEAVRSGAIGKILEVNNPDSDDRIEIIIER